MENNQPGLIQKLFGMFMSGINSRIPIRSNIYNKKGYQAIGTTGSKLFDIDRKSPLLGNANASNLISGYYERLLELKGYQLLDITKLATNFFSDYIVNFLSDEGGGSQIVSIMNEDGTNNQQVTDRINQILTKDIRIFDFIRNHIQDFVFFGQYYAMLVSSRDESGHLKFRLEELIDPVSVIRKKKRKKGGSNEMEDLFLAKGEGGIILEIPKKEIIYIANLDLRLVNDLADKVEFNGYKRKQDDPITSFLNQSNKPKPYQPNVNKNQYVLKEGVAIDDSKEGKENRRKVLVNESYTTSEPLFYSLLLKVKELVIKELLVSLISLRDLSSVQIFLLQFDKNIPLEAASELCKRAAKLTNNTNELASFLTSQFDAVSFIENSLTQGTKFIPDYGGSLSAKNPMLPLDKLSDKYIEIMQTLDQCRAAILGPLGLPVSLTDSTSGSKWQVLQQSERANSKVASFLSGIKSSVTDLVCNLYEIIYSETLDPSLVKLHISEKTSVEYNNQINQSESINGLLQSINAILQGSLQMLDMGAPYLDPKNYLTYIQNLIRDIDPNTESIINEKSINLYLQMVNAKLGQQFEQFGLDPSILQEDDDQQQQQQQ